MIDYKNEIEAQAEFMNEYEDWGMEPESMEGLINRVNKILNEEGIIERPATEWDRLIMMGGDDWAPLQVAQAILEK